MAEGADLETVTSALRRPTEEDQREIDTLTQKVEDIQANLDAQTRLLSDKNAKIDALDKALHQKKIQTVPPEEEGERIRGRSQSDRLCGRSGNPGKPAIRFPDPDGTCREIESFP